MAVNTQTLNVDLNTGKNLPTAYTHQNDTTRQFVFNVFNNGTAFILTNYTAKFAFVSAKTHGGYTVVAGSSMVSGTVSGNTVTVVLPAIYSQVAGAGLLTMILTSSNSTVRPVNIRLVVQKSADGDDVIAGASDFPTTLQGFVNSWVSENGSSLVSTWASQNGSQIMTSATNTWMNTNADRIIETKTNAWLTTNGGDLVEDYIEPYIATQASLNETTNVVTFKDTNNNEIYTLDLSGLAPSVDNTLSEEGVPADAKATGEAIAELETEITGIQTEVSGIATQIDTINGEVI